MTAKEPTPMPCVLRPTAPMAPPARRLPDAALLDLCPILGVCVPDLEPQQRAIPHPRYVIVECGKDEEVLLRDSWESGAPVEIAGVRFEMAVVARRRSWWRPMLVRGIPVR